jgi:UPF0716 protein FxsA
MMQIGLLLLFVAAPLLELALLIKTGQWIGFWPTLAIVVGTGIAGSLIVRQQGFAVARRLLQDADQPSEMLDAMINGGLMLAAGILLILPGLCTDVLGLLLLIPPLRRQVAYRIARHGRWSVMQTRERWSASRRPSGDDGARGAHTAPKQPQPGRRSGAVIDGEFERLDDDRPPKDTADRSRGGKP